MYNKKNKKNIVQYCFNCLQIKPCSCVGRPSKIDPTILSKLQLGFNNGLNDEEACAYANIHPSLLYRFQEEHPEFREQKKQWKLNPLLVARKTVLGSLQDPQYAWRYIERKDPDLKPVNKVEHAGKIQTEDVTSPLTPAEQVAVDVFNKTLAEQRKEQRKQMLNDKPL